MTANRARLVLVVSASALLAVVCGIVFFVSHRVKTAMSADGGEKMPLGFVALPFQEFPVEWLGGGEVKAVAVSADSLWTAGAFGVMNENGIYRGLPSMRVSAMTLWRGRPLIALEAGGLFLLKDRQWDELRTGFGVLQARCLTEGVGGELYIGAAQGLFLAQWGGNAIERLHSAPVRSIAIGDGIILAGGEKGLVRISGGRANSLAAPDPWIEWIGIRNNRIVLLTAQGLATGPLDGEIRPMPREAGGAAQLGDDIYFVGENSIFKMDQGDRFTQEYLPQAPRRIFVSGEVLFADTDAGLYRKGPQGWVLARNRAASLPPGFAHVTALAHYQGQLVVGAFDGGVAIGAWNQNGASDWRALPTTNAWGVNAILSSGNALTVASLRGPSRLEGRTIKPLAPVGAAFSIAQTPQGIAIGYGHGVRLPGGQFLSAFHGLPGNQALALLQDDYLYVGTPSGLGAISEARVAWRTVAGDGLLPHPWVTALASHKNTVYIGTYGGGIVSRAQKEGQIKGSFRSFPETMDLKINAGCIAVAKGSLFIGAEGKGLYRLSGDAMRFEPVALPLPSNSVTALLPDGEFLLVGTNEGIAKLPLQILKPQDI